MNVRYVVSFRWIADRFELYLDARFRYRQTNSGNLLLWKSTQTIHFLSVEKSESHFGVGEVKH